MVKECRECGEEVNTCDYCHDELPVDAEIICVDDPFHGGCHLHFCSTDCYEGWLHDAFPPTYSTVEGTDD